MNKIFKVIGLSVLVLVVVALLLFRPRITVQYQSSLGGPEEEAILLLANNGHLADIQRAVTLSGKDIDDISYKGGSLLYWAAHYNQLEVAEWLLTEGANPNGITPGMPPLLTAVIHKHLSMVNLLVKWGADPDIDVGDGETVRGFAEFGGNTDIIEALPTPENITEGTR